MTSVKSLLNKIANPSNNVVIQRVLHSTEIKTNRRLIAEAVYNKSDFFCVSSNIKFTNFFTYFIANQSLLGSQQREIKYNDSIMEYKNSEDLSKNYNHPYSISEVEVGQTAVIHYKLQAYNPNFLVLHFSQDSKNLNQPDFSVYDLLLKKFVGIYQLKMRCLPFKSKRGAEDFMFDLYNSYGEVSQVIVSINNKQDLTLLSGIINENEKFRDIFILHDTTNLLGLSTPTDYTKQIALSAYSSKLDKLEAKLSSNIHYNTNPNNERIPAPFVSTIKEFNHWRKHLKHKNYQSSVDGEQNRALNLFIEQDHSFDDVD